MWRTHIFCNLKKTFRLLDFVFESVFVKIEVTPRKFIVVGNIFLPFACPLFEFFFFSFLCFLPLSFLFSFFLHLFSFFLCLMFGQLVSWHSVFSWRSVLVPTTTPPSALLPGSQPRHCYLHFRLVFVCRYTSCLSAVSVALCLGGHLGRLPVCFELPYTVQHCHLHTPHTLHHPHSYLVHTAYTAPSHIA